MKNNINKKDLKEKYFKTKKAINLDISKKKQNRIKNRKIIFAKVTTIDQSHLNIFKN